MENAVDALKMAFAVMVFVMALSITMFMFSQARETADIVLHKTDITSFMEYEEANQDSENRVVGLETIIPTLYKYYKENYTVVFRNANGTPLEVYKTKTNTSLWSEGYTNEYYGNKSERVCSFDVDEETKRHEPWTGSMQFYKANLDAFLNGGEFKNPSGNAEMNYKYDGFIEKYKNARFIENLGEYTYNADVTQTNDSGEKHDYTDSTALVKNKKKRVIIYTLKN